MKGDLVGYCNRCGADCFEEVRHRCRTTLIGAAELVSLKSAIAKFDRRLKAKPIWPPSMQPLHAELSDALNEFRLALEAFGRGRKVLDGHISTKDPGRTPGQ